MNAVVEQIHSEFSEAEEILLQSVKKQLARAASTDKSRLNSLAALGFSNFKELREISPEERFEMEAAFGKGTTIIDIITGNVN